MVLSDAAWIAITGVGGTLITTIGALVLHKLTQIHTVTNSTLSTTKAELGAARAEIAHLAQLLTRADQDKALSLLREGVPNSIPAATPEARAVSKIGEHIEEIEKHTEQTARNTDP